MLNKFYQKIQVIMTMLGLYDGQCDGVWGPKCIEAKRKWELMDEFEPGVPSNGLPFNGRGKLPKGMNYAFKDLDIIWDQWDQEKADKILAEKGQLLTHDLVHEHVMGAQEKQEQPQADEPVASANTVSQEPVQAKMLNTAPAESESEKEPVEDDEPVEDEDQEDEEVLEEDDEDDSDEDDSDDSEEHTLEDEQEITEENTAPEPAQVQPTKNNNWTKRR